MSGYQIKVTLDVHPKAWRRLQIPSKITFKELSAILIESMGWEGYHLSGFSINKAGETIFIENYPDDEGLQREYKHRGVLDGKKVKIDKYLIENDKFLFIYDYGDNWKHEILLEEVLEDYKNKYAQVVTYRGNCPPEDCGGYLGYIKLMYGEDEEAEEMRQYYEIFKYNKAKTNENLKNLKEIEKALEEMFEDE